MLIEFWNMTLVKLWRECQRQKEILKKKKKQNQQCAGFRLEVTIAATPTHYLKTGEKQINKTCQR